MEFFKHGYTAAQLIEEKEKYERKKFKSRVNKYGITEEDYFHMLSVQNGCCGRCYKPMKKPIIDHDHNTGKVRGLLCQSCNTTISTKGDHWAALFNI